jgi:hypothetical protein
MNKLSLGAKRIQNTEDRSQKTEDRHLEPETLEPGTG